MQPRRPVLPLLDIAVEFDHEPENVPITGFTMIYGCASSTTARIAVREIHWQRPPDDVTPWRSLFAGEVDNEIFCCKAIIISRNYSALLQLHPRRRTMHCSRGTHRLRILSAPQICRVAYQFGRPMRFLPSRSSIGEIALCPPPAVAELPPRQVASDGLFNIGARHGHVGDRIRKPVASLSDRGHRSQSL